MEQGKTAIGRQQGQRGMFGVGGSLLLLVLWACGGGSDSGSPSVALSLNDGRLSATLRQAPVVDILAELGRQAQIRIHVEGMVSTERVSAEFTNLPLEEGIKRILQGKNYALTYSDSRGDRFGGPKVVGIRILPTSTLPLPSAPLSEWATGREPQSRISEMIRESKIDDRSEPTSLLSATRDADPRARRAAVKALGDSGDESAVDVLAQILLNDRDKKVRRAATEALAEIGSLSASIVLGRALNDRDPVVRRNAEEAIIAIGGEQALTLLHGAGRD